MAQVNVATSQNLTSVVYAAGDTINVNDGVTLTINTSWGATAPAIVQALGTGRIEVSNNSITTPILLDFLVNANSCGFSAQQNGVVQVRGNWIQVATGSNTANQTVLTANNVSGVSIDYPTLVEVETASGSNAYEIWSVIPEAVTNGEANTLGFNKPPTTVGTVSVTTGGVITGTGTNFLSTDVGIKIKFPSITRDFVVSAVTSTTSCTIQEMDGTIYTGGVLTGVTYILRNGSCIYRNQVGNGDLGKVLFYNPVTTVVTCGDGTNGTMIPSGAKVRIPNIHISSKLSSTTLAAAITSTAAQAITLTAAVGPATNTAFSATADLGTLLLINGTTVERIHYTTRSGTAVSAIGQTRGMFGTTAQASFPIGTNVYWLPAQSSSTQSANMLLSASGTLDAEICTFGSRFTFNINNYASLRLVHIGSVRFNTTGSAGPFTIDNYSTLGLGFVIPGITTLAGATHAFTAMLGTGSITNITCCDNFYGHNTTSSAVSLSNVPALTNFNNIKVRIWNRGTNFSGSVIRGIGLSNITTANKITNLYVAGAPLTLSVASNLEFEGIQVADQPYAEGSSSSNGLSNIYYSNAVGCITRGISLWGNGLPSRTQLITTDTGCQSCVFHNKGYASINGNGQLASIISDQGLNTTITHFTINNARASTTGGVLQAAVVTNTGSLVRMCLIDTITTATTNTGIASKGKQIYDFIAGPHRIWSSSTTTAVLANMFDVQSIVVLSNVAKTVGSIFVGPFSAQSAYSMYSSITGTVSFDNLGRIYMPTSGDSIIINSITPLCGVSSFNTSGTFQYNYDLGTGTNPVPAGTTLEFRMSNYGTANTGSWTTYTSMTDFETARTALTGYSTSVGLDLQLRITQTTTSAGRYVMNMSLPINLDSSYNPSVSASSLSITNSVASSRFAIYDNTTPATPVLLNNTTLSSTSATLAVPYNFDGTSIAYRLVNRRAGYTFVNVTGTYNQTSQSLPVTLSQVLSTSGSALYISGQSGATINHSTQKITVTSNITLQQLWSICQDNLTQLANLTVADFFSTANGSSYTCTYDIELNNATLSGPGTISMPTKTLSLVGTGDTQVIYTDISGQHVEVLAPNLISGTRVQLYNMTDSSELYNGVIGSGGLRFKTIYTADKTVRLRAAYCVGTTAKDEVEATGSLSGTGATFLNSQTNEVVYNALGLDGSTMTEFAADFPNVQVDITDGDGVTSCQRLYAWYHYIITTSSGIVQFFNGMEASDTANYQVKTAILNLTLDNRSATPVMIVGGYLYRDDGATVIAAASGSIQLDPSKAYVANSDQINTKLDKTLTVAKFLALK
jgi:hypothetical protein